MPRTSVITEHYNHANLLHALLLLSGSRQWRAAQLAEVARERERAVQQGEHVADLDAARRRLQRVAEAEDWLKRCHAVAKSKDERTGLRARTVTYEKKGRLQLGRRYAAGTIINERGKMRSLSLQGTLRELRPLLVGDRLQDVDMVNSLPTIAHHLATSVLGLNLPALAAYVSDCEHLRASIAQFHGVDREAAKALPIRLLHGGGYAAWLHDFGLPPTSPPHTEVVRLSAELGVLRKHLLANPRFAKVTELLRTELVAAGKRKRDDEYGIAISTFAVILQELEDRVLGVIERSLAEAAWVVESLQFDGLLVRHRDDANLEAALKAAEARVSTALGGLSIQLKIKPLYQLPLAPIFRTFQTGGVPIPIRPPAALAAVKHGDSV